VPPDRRARATPPGVAPVVLSFTRPVRGNCGSAASALSARALTGRQ
jgi:hypothetical protein